MRNRLSQCWDAITVMAAVVIGAFLCLENDLSEVMREERHYREQTHGR